MMEGSGHEGVMSEEQLELEMDLFIDDEVELLKIPVMCKSICHAICLSSDINEIGVLYRKLYGRSVCIRPSLSVIIDSCMIIARAVPNAVVTDENVGVVKHWANEMIKVYESQGELLVRHFEIKRHQKLMDSESKKHRENMRIVLAVSMISVILSVIAISI